MPVCRTNPTSDCALPTELHDTPYIYSIIQAAGSHTNLRQHRRAHPHYWTCNQDSLFNSFCMLRCHRNHSAFNSHNFPRTCTTTYLFGMLLCHSNRHAPTRDACRFGTYLVSSGCTYGLVTVSFHSICIEVSFAAVSAHGFARPFRITRHHSCHCVFSIFSLLAGIALCTSLGVCGRCRIRTCDGNRIFYFCLRPLSQPSCFVCCYGIATITSPSSTP